MGCTSSKAKAVDGAPLPTTIDVVAANTEGTDPTSTFSEARELLGGSDAQEQAADSAERAVLAAEGDGIIDIGGIVDVAGAVGSLIPADSALGAFALEAGAALMETFEHVPFIAPAAFLIGAVARASAEAIILKEDARSFAGAARRVEKCMLKAKMMETQREAVDAIVKVLEESLVLVKHLATRGIVSSVVRALRDARKLADYKEDLTEAVGLMQLECQVELTQLKMIELNQSKELEAKIEEMGGLDECAACKDKTAALSMFMKKSDALVCAKVDMLVEQTKSSAQEVTSSVNRLSRISMSGQANMDAHFARMQLQTEKAAARNAVMEQQVSLLCNMLGDVKGLMTKCPVPTNEPARLVAVHAAGAVGMTTEAEAYPEIEQCAREVWKLMRGDICIAVNFLDENISHFPVFYPPSPDSSEPVNEAASDPASVTSPRKATACQHVIARAEVVEFVGMDNAPPQPTPEEFEILSRVDPTIAKKTAENMEQGLVCSKEHGCPFTATWWDLQANAASTVWYRGTPIFCDGSAIGSFCCVCPDGKPEGFDERALFVVEANVKRIGIALERQAAKRRSYHLSRLAETRCRGAQADEANEWAKNGMAQLPAAGCPLPPLPEMNKPRKATSSLPLPPAKTTGMLATIVSQATPDLFDEADDLINFVY